MDKHYVTLTSSQFEAMNSRNILDILQPTWDTQFKLIPLHTHTYT